MTTDTRHLGRCEAHGTPVLFRPGADCPMCTIMVEDEPLDADTVEWIGLDSTGRSFDPRFPYRPSNLLPPELEALTEYVTSLCECRHPGYDGHDMRSVRPRA